MKRVTTFFQQLNYFYLIIFHSFDLNLETFILNLISTLTFPIQQLTFTLEKCPLYSEHLGHFCENKMSTFSPDLAFYTNITTSGGWEGLR